MEIHLVPAIKNAGINNRLYLFNGDALLTQGSNTLQIQCTLYFNWYPSVRLLAEGAIEEQLELGKAILKTAKNEYIINITDIRSKVRDNSHYFIASICQDKALLSENKKVLFDLINFINYIGTPTRKNNNSKSWSRDRMHIKNNDFVLTIDKKLKSDELFKTLRHTGGYAFTHDCSLQIVNSSIDIESFIKNLHYTLSFINASWCGPIVLFQRHKAGRFSKYLNTNVNIYRYKKRCFSKFQANDIENAIQLFLKKFQIENWNSILQHLIHIYVSCTDTLTKTIEMALILIQSGLERIAHFILVEEREIISNTQYEKKNAKEKIKLLLDNMHIPYTITEESPYLFNYNRGRNLSLVDIFVDLRNPYTHPNSTKISKVSNLDSQLRIDIWESGLWILELAILNMIEYKGKYSIRTYKGEYEKVEDVPWSRKTLNQFR